MFLRIFVSPQSWSDTRAHRRLNSSTLQTFVRSSLFKSHEHHAAQDFATIIDIMFMSFLPTSCRLRRMMECLSGLFYKNLSTIEFKELPQQSTRKIDGPLIKPILDVSPE